MPSTARSGWRARPRSTGFSWEALRGAAQVSVRPGPGAWAAAQRDLLPVPPLPLPRGEWRRPPDRALPSYVKKCDPHLMVPPGQWDPFNRKCRNRGSSSYCHYWHKQRQGDNGAHLCGSRVPASRCLVLSAEQPRSPGLGVASVQDRVPASWEGQKGFQKIKVTVPESKCSQASSRVVQCTT